MIFLRLLEGISKIFWPRSEIVQFHDLKDPLKKTSEGRLEQDDF